MSRDIIMMGLNFPWWIQTALIGYISKEAIGQTATAQPKKSSVTPGSTCYACSKISFWTKAFATFSLFRKTLIKVLIDEVNFHYNLYRSTDPSLLIVKD